MFKMIGIFLLAVIILIILFLIKAITAPIVPKDYIEKTETGGHLEAKYLNMGGYDVSYFEKETDESFKKFEVYYPSELENKNRTYPVVVFVNGTGVVGSKYKALFAHLASWGFIVIGNEEKESWNGYASEKSLAFIVKENENKDSVFYGKVDVDHIGVTGHSQGGVGVFTTITAHEHRHLYKTAVALSPTHEEQSSAFGWRYNLTEIEIPILLIAGTKGDVETKLVIPYDRMIAMYEKIRSPKAMMRRKGAEHGQMLFIADGYVTAWFMW